MVKKIFLDFGNFKKFLKNSKKNFFMAPPRPLKTSHHQSNS
jgi:hypothetical protein